ncbi:MAG: nuclear transport factor 2 family protein [Actinomycetota bacterium]
MGPSLSFLDPEIELHIGSRTSGFIAPDLLGVHRGHEGYLRVWEAILDAWDDLRLEHEEVIDFGGQLLAGGRFRGHGTFSGISLDEPLFSVFTLRRGLVIRQDDFVERDEALEAAGLSE